MKDVFCARKVKQPVLTGCLTDRIHHQVKSELDDSERECTERKEHERDEAELGPFSGRANRTLHGSKHFVSFRSG